MTAMDRLLAREKEIEVLEERVELELDEAGVAKVFRDMKNKWGVPRLQHRNPQDPHIDHRFDIRLLADKFVVWIDRGEQV